MKWTRASVAEHAAEKGYEPVQVDGIPEGFSFIAPDIEIGDKVHKGNFIAFIPNGEQMVQAENLFDLLEKYFNSPKQH